MSAAFEDFRNVLGSSSLQQTLEICDRSGSLLAQLHGEHAVKSLLFGDALRAKADELNGTERSAFVANNFIRLMSVFDKLHHRLVDEFPTKRAAWDNMFSTGIPASGSSVILLMSDDGCQAALVAASELIAHYDRLVNSFSGMQSFSEKAIDDTANELKEHKKFEKELAVKVDRLETDANQAKKALVEEQERAAAMTVRMAKLASELGGLAGAKDSKKKDQASLMTLVERSFDDLKRKLESLEKSNVSQKDYYAREAEIGALKAENTKLLENVRDAQADRQRALEDNERLREQLQKLRAEKQADGSGKKKKSK